MLNIPESVKTLFKQDGVRKNFRVHFPNGELPDITNENVVQESVKFTNSICSQDVLKFGLTEASVLEFETVGIANMYGMTIEAGIEIDLSSLTAAQISEIESGAWDGVYVDAANSDIGFAYFRIPYGQFRIDSCPRDHQAMAHRKVTAYGASPLKVRNNPFESKKQSTLNLPSVYDANMFNLTTEIMGYNMPETLSSFTETELSISSQDPISVSAFPSITTRQVFKKSSGDSITIAANMTRSYAYSEGSGTPSNPRRIKSNALFSAEFNYSYFSLISRLANLLENYNPSNPIDLAESGFTNWIDAAKAVFERNDNGPNHIYPNVTYFLRTGDLANKEYQRVNLDSSTPVFYPYIGTYTDQEIVANDGIFECVVFPTKVTVSALQDMRILINNEPIAPPTIKLLEPPATIPDATFPFPSTAEGSISTVNYNFKAYSYKPEGNLVQLINAWMELNAKFGKANLQGAFEEVQLSKGNPVAVPPGLFENFWWDEYDVLPVGSVRYKLKVKSGETEEEKELTYQFGDGESVYDMTDNIILSSCSTEDQVISLLNDYFIPNLDALMFTPIDLTMKGLPYIEPGDYLAVTAEDGTIANSFNMRQTINGIQVLTAEIESTSGDIIESEEGET